MSNSDIDKVARKEGETLAQYIPRLGTTSLEFQPGSRWTYSPGAGFETLGRIVEIVSGMPLDQFFRQRIFDPLGMKDIAFWPTESHMDARRFRLPAWCQRPDQADSPPTTPVLAASTSALPEVSTARQRTTFLSV